jgi:anti-anti-sigma factor
VRFGHTVERCGGELTIVLAGEVDAESAEELRRVLLDAVAQRPTRLAVDLRGLVFIDSASIGALVAARRAATRRRCVFRVVEPTGQVLRLLTVAGVLAVLTGADSRAEDDPATGCRRSSNKSSASSGVCQHLTPIAGAPATRPSRAARGCGR